MSRIIKFRAWHIERKKMYQIGGITFRNHFIGCNALDVENNTIGDTIGVNSENQKCFELIQFSGILDENKKEIFEGDILAVKNWHYNSLYICKLNFGCFYFENNEEKLTLFDQSRIFTVVGNVYENSDLLS